MTKIERRVILEQKGNLDLREKEKYNMETYFRIEILFDNLICVIDKLLINVDKNQHQEHAEHLVRLRKIAKSGLQSLELYETDALKNKLPLLVLNQSYIILEEFVNAINFGKLENLSNPIKANTPSEIGALIGVLRIFKVIVNLDLGRIKSNKSPEFIDFNSLLYPINIRGVAEYNFHLKQKINRAERIKARIVKSRGELTLPQAKVLVDFNKYISSISKDSQINFANNIVASLTEYSSSGNETLDKILGQLYILPQLVQVEIRTHFNQLANQKAIAEVLQIKPILEIPEARVDVDKISFEDYVSNFEWLDVGNCSTKTLTPTAQKNLFELLNSLDSIYKTAPTVDLIGTLQTQIALSGCEAVTNPLIKKLTRIRNKSWHSVRLTEGSGTGAQRAIFEKKPNESKYRLIFLGDHGDYDKFIKNC